MIGRALNRPVLAIATMALLFVAAPLLAQVDKATIEAFVVDDSGAAVPGVTVTITNSETGYVSTAVTGPNGEARVIALPPGSYRVDFALDGFANLQQNVVLRIGQTARLNTTLKPATAETITVTAVAPVVDVYKTDSSTNILPEQIEELPVADREFEKLAFITPGVARERGDFRFIKGGPVIGAGGNASQSAVLVDGHDYTDPLLGMARTRFSQDAIREFRVIANRFDTEIGGSAGGALSIVTRSGTNDIKGSAFGFYRADDLRSKGEFETESLPYERTQFGFALGGPIIADRLHYFASVEQIGEDDIALFRPRGAFTSLADDVPNTFDQTLAFLGFDSQLSTTQSVGAKFVYEKYEEDNFRVGGVADISYGQQLNRDNWNVALQHNFIASASMLNDIRFQVGTRKYEEPTNSDAVAEWFSAGNTLMTGTNILGDMLGESDQWEFRDTFHYHMNVGQGSHDIKTGFSYMDISERQILDTFQNGLFLWRDDTRTFPIVYSYGIGSSDATAETERWALFVEDSWRPNAKLSVNLGVRYDMDTKGNNPDFEHPLVPNGRDKDTDNFQPRFGFSYDLAGNGQYFVRGGAGVFTGRYLLIPALQELQYNGVTGRKLMSRVNGLLFGLPAFALDPANPMTTGIPNKLDINLIDSELEAPEATQATLGFTTRLGQSNLYFDAEGIYIDGDKEIVVRDVNYNPATPRVRPNPNYNQINTYTNDGHSEYKALVLALNGTFGKGHLFTSSVTFADKKNISDDFSPEFPFGYPNNPADIEAEYGPSRSAEDVRVVLSAVFRAPWQITVAPIFEYGSGQPWTRRLGYDANFDGKNSDRRPGVGRNEEEGPEFKSLNLRLTKGFPIGSYGEVDFIVEGFNVLDTTNYDVNSVSAAEYLTAPTTANPNPVNPNFGKYSATLRPREVQLGVRWAF
ncbi:MAG: TonB-dependent receptor domain-containing protein [Thermoanaerobaculia bacterium]